jgi:DNA polymerase III subunit epsilon
MNTCFIDFETTGIDVFKDHPVEFGAILVDENLNIIDEFYSRINPDRKRKLKASALKTHGIELDSLVNIPTGNIVLSSFFSRFGTNFRLASWNISFDVL